MTGAGQPEEQGQDGAHQDRMQGSHVVVLKVKSSTLNLKTLHSEGTEWVSSFGTCYRILLDVKGQGWGGTARGTPSPTSTPSSILLSKKKRKKKKTYLLSLLALKHETHSRPLKSIRAGHSTRLRSVQTAPGDLDSLLSRNNEKWWHIHTLFLAQCHISDQNRKPLVGPSPVHVFSTAIYDPCRADSTVHSVPTTLHLNGKTNHLPVLRPLHVPLCLICCIFAFHTSIWC